MRTVISTSASNSLRTAATVKSPREHDPCAALLEHRLAVQLLSPRLIINTAIAGAAPHHSQVWRSGKKEAVAALQLAGRVRGEHRRDALRFELRDAPQPNARAHVPRPRCKTHGCHG